MVVQNVVVGAGFAGSVLARRLAEEKGQDVLIVEKKNHIGGHAFDKHNEHGVLIHVYGPHIFHTSDERVWNWISRFTEWHHYQHRVLSYVDGRLVPLPINIDTINELLGYSFGAEEFEAWLGKQKMALPDIRNSEEAVLSQGGTFIYEKFFKNYTQKQWNRSAAELDASVVKRIPFRYNRDSRYFSDPFQGVPRSGYAALFENLLDHPRIRLLLNTPWEDVKEEINYKKLYYTGPVDEFFGSKYGRLPYRSVRFEYETFYDREFFQQAGTVNYPNDYKFTRISEYKYFTGQRVNHTTIAREYSSDDGDPFYIVPGGGNSDALEKYLQETKRTKDVAFIGRLAEYKYYNMDQVVARALDEEI